MLTAVTDPKSRHLAMLLVDTGPLVALIDKKDGLHKRAATTAAGIQTDLMTTEACLTETLYLLGDAGGWQAQAVIRGMVDSGDLQVFRAPPNGPQWAFAFMAKFKDQPCDYADATLLVAAEETGLRRIFTFDRHFHAYRLTDGTALEVTR